MYRPYTPRAFFPWLHHKFKLKLYAHICSTNNWVFPIFSYVILYNSNVTNLFHIHFGDLKICFLKGFRKWKLIDIIKILMCIIDIRLYYWMFKILFSGFIVNLTSDLVFSSKTGTVIDSFLYIIESNYINVWYFI